MQKYKKYLYRKRYFFVLFQKKTQEPQSPCVISIFVKAFRTRIAAFFQTQAFLPISNASCSLVLPAISFGPPTPPQKMWPLSVDLP